MNKIVAGAGSIVALAALFLTACGTSKEPPVGAAPVPTTVTDENGEQSLAVIHAGETAAKAFELSPTDTHPDPEADGFIARRRARRARSSSRPRGSATSTDRRSPPRSRTRWIFGPLPSRTSRTPSRPAPPQVAHPPAKATTK